MPAPSSLSRRCLLQGTALLPALAAAGRLNGALARFPGPARWGSPLPALVASNTAFALDLYATLHKSATGNLLFSPYSVSQALAMTLAGARGATARQMAQTLSFTQDQLTLNATFASLTTDLVARGNITANAAAAEARRLRIANALWGERTYPFSPAYSALITRAYGAGLQPVDFARAPEAARGAINTWVAEQTEDRILSIVPPGAITKDTRLVLANALYFFGPWRTPFPRNATGQDLFHLLDGTTATVPFMVQQEYLGYARGDGFQAVELPYAQEGFALTVLMPDAGRFDAFEAALDAATLAAMLVRIEGTEIVLHLPKFTFDFGASLVAVLASLGMVDAFTKRADFTGMVAGKPPTPLGLTGVFHKAFIAVDERSTEATAVTTVPVASPMASPGPPPPLEVRIDRPFVFAIRDTETETVLFLGRVLDPRG